MELFILDSNFEMLQIVDNAESVLWDKKFRGEGYCEIYAPCADYLTECLVRGNYVYRTDDDMFCRIETIEVTTNADTGDYITATARDICCLLAGRVVVNQITYSGTVGGFMSKLLTENIISATDENRRISNFKIDSTNLAGFTNTISVSTAADTLLQIVVAACRTFDLGFRISFNPTDKTLNFALKRGEKRMSASSENYVEFSPDFSNILTTDYKDDEASYKNVAYVGYKTLDDSFALAKVERLTEASDPAGVARREVYADGTGASREVTEEELKELFPSAYKVSNAYYIMDGGTSVKVADIVDDTITLTDVGYYPLLQQIGLTALYSAARSKTFSGTVDTIDTYAYKVDYDLGDIVKVKDDYGNESNAQITEILESEDNDSGYLLTPYFDNEGE